MNMKVLKILFPLTGASITKGWFWGGDSESLFPFWLALWDYLFFVLLQVSALNPTLSPKSSSFDAVICEILTCGLKVFIPSCFVKDILLKYPIYQNF